MTGIQNLARLGALASIASLLTSTALGQDSKLTALDAAMGDTLGRAVAIDGDTAVVGAPLEDTGASAAGAAYVFVKSGAEWVQQAKLTASDGDEDDRFGSSVAISGDTVVVGAPLDDLTGPGPGASGLEADWGSAYVFVRGGTSWTQQEKLVAADFDPFDRFGASVAVSGDRAAIGATGAEGNDEGSGALYVFLRTGTSWAQEDKVGASDGATNDSLGYSIAMDGDTVVVGATGNDVAADNAGAAYVFTRSGASWSQQARLEAGDASASDSFGWSVDIDADTAVVGARKGDGGVVDSGTAYVYTRSGTSWSQEAELAASNGGSLDVFGSAVAVSGDRAVVGAPGQDTAGTNSGSVYLFERDGASWTQADEVIPVGVGSFDSLGVALALSGETAVAGSPFDDEGGSNAGAAYVIGVSDPFTNYCQSTVNSTGFAAEMFQSGSNSIAANDLVLLAAPVPDEFGIFFYGPNAAEMPFGEGFLCVGGQLFRFPVISAEFGVFSQPVDYTDPPEAAGQITAGSTWRFQCWFRDPAGGGAGFNLSDGLEGTFVP